MIMLRAVLSSFALLPTMVLCYLPCGTFIAVCMGMLMHFWQLDAEGQRSFASSCSCAIRAFERLNVTRLSGLWAVLRPPIWLLTSRQHDTCQDGAKT